MNVMEKVDCNKIRAIHTLRVNVKSLSIEAQAIRAETRRAGKDFKNGLALHRTMVVRPQARLTHLALAYVRGRKYKTVENVAMTPVCHKALSQKINRHYPGLSTEKSVRTWLGA